MYLRDAHVIQDQHREALRASSEEVMDLVSALPADILHLCVCLVLRLQGVVF